MIRILISAAIILAGVTASALQNQIPNAPPPNGPSLASIRGVWRNIERVIPDAEPGARLDPFAHVPVGTQTDLQPGLLIITEKSLQPDDRHGRATAPQD